MNCVMLNRMSVNIRNYFFELASNHVGIVAKIIYRQQIYSLDFQALSLAQGVKGYATICMSEGESLEIEAIIIYMSLN